MKSDNIICLICQNTIAVIKEHNIKRHCFTKHAAKFDGIEGQLRFDEIEQFKKSLIMQEGLHAYEKDTELVTELNFEISQAIVEKGKAYSNGEFIKNYLELFTRRVLQKRNV